MPPKTLTQVSPLLRRQCFLDCGACAELVAAFGHLANTPNHSPGSVPGIRWQPNRTEIPGTVVCERSTEGVANHLTNLRHRVLHETKAFFSVSKLAIEFTLVTEMRVTDAHALHADNARRTADGRWEQNHTPWRVYATMLYLNSCGVDYDGGTLRFPSCSEEVMPRTGDLVGFACGPEREHEVTPIQSGSRYSISMWLTDQVSRAESWGVTL